MNKYLSEIEIIASKRFGDQPARKFFDDTRRFVDCVYELLERNVRSNYGKIALVLWPKSALEEHPTPDHEFDSISGVCMINIAYDLSLHTGEESAQKREKMVIDLFEKAVASCPERVGIDKSAFSRILDASRV